MKIRKMFASMAVILLVTMMTVIYAQSNGGSGRKSTQTANATTGGAVPHAPNASTNTPATNNGVISANPMTPEEIARHDALFAASTAYTTQANKLLEDGDANEAIAACLNALQAAPVIQGRRLHVPFVADLLGQAYLKAGDYKNAIYWLQGGRKTTIRPGQNLDLSLAYLKLGDYQDALRFYPAGALEKPVFDDQPTPEEDLPGTLTPDALEASILLARGINAFFEGRYNDSSPDFERAHALAPNSALASYFCADALARNHDYTHARALLQSAAAKNDIVGKFAGRNLYNIPVK